MKNQTIVLLTLGVACAAGAFAASDATNDIHQKALDVLRKTIDSLENKQAPPSNTAPPAREPTFADVEQLYLKGKITAREFQKYLEDHKLDPAKLTNHETQSRAVEVLRKEVDKAEAGRPNSAAAKASSPAQETRTDEQSGLSDLDKKLDELLRLKAARETTIATNTASLRGTNAAAASAPKTKRQRLDDLLKLYIDGKIAEADYKEKRGKLIAEPE